MSVRVLGIEWEGVYSCRLCGSSCSTSQWSEPHKKKYCLGVLEEMIERGEFVRSSESRAGDVAFERELARVGWTTQPSSNGEGKTR